MFLFAAVPLSVLAPLPLASAGLAVSKMLTLLVARICWHDILRTRADHAMRRTHTYMLTHADVSYIA